MLVSEKSCIFCIFSPLASSWPGRRGRRQHILAWPGRRGAHISLAREARRRGWPLEEAPVARCASNFNFAGEVSKLRASHGIVNL